MKLFYYGKDGGYESHVWGFWLVEIKSLFSIVLLKFKHGTRDAYHEHAFNSISWLLKGRLLERFKDSGYKWHAPSFRAIITRRSDFHKVRSYGTSWVLSFRGPWSKTWKEYSAREGLVTLTNGRQKV